MSEWDREFLSATGLNQPSVARILGKTRQAVGNGVNREKDYFSEQDVKLILYYFQETAPDKVAACRQFLGDKYTFATSPTIEAMLNNASEVWVMAPSFIHKSRDHPHIVSIFNQIAEHSDTAEIVLFSDTLINLHVAANAFGNTARNAEKFACMTESEGAFSLLSQIIINPRTNPRCFIIGKTDTLTEMSPSESLLMVAALAVYASHAIDLRAASLKDIQQLHDLRNDLNKPCPK